MNRLAAVGLLVLVFAGFALYVLETEPRWYERLRYPLRYEQIVMGHAENYHLDPQLVAAVIYQESKFDADAVSSSGAVGLMQLLPETAQGIADRTGGTAGTNRTSSTRSSTSATARGTSAICSTSTATRSSRSPRTTPARRTSIAGAKRGSGSSSPRRALRRARAEAEGDLRRRLPLGARAVLSFRPCASRLRCSWLSSRSFRRLPTSPSRTCATCGTSVFGDLGQGWQERAIVAGHVSFVGLKNGYQRWRPGGPGGWPVKVLVVVDPNAAPTVTIAARSRGHASLGYNDIRHNGRGVPLDRGTQSVRFEACRPNAAREPWNRGTQFAGYFLVSGRRCVYVDVHDRGQDHSARPPLRRAAVRAANDARRLIRRARSAGRDPEARRRSCARWRGRWRRS